MEISLRSSVDPLPEILGAVGVRCNEVTVRTDLPESLRSYWDGGTRDYWTFYDLLSHKILPVPQNGSMFDRTEYGISKLPPNTVLVQRKSFRGKQFVTVYADESTVVPMLPKPCELSEDEWIVLKCTSGYKSSYAGIKNYRLYEARKEHPHMNETLWQAAKDSLIAKRLLNRNGAINPDGRNALRTCGRFS